MKQHLILIGMMGTGKTSVGRALSERLGLPMTDTDRMIEQTTGQTITQLFKEQGEQGFRDIETQVLSQVLAEAPRVIATGGGIVLRDENVERMKQRGWVVCLQASAEEICQRLAGDTNRPLLHGDLKQRVRQLMQERAGKYDFADWKVETTGRTASEVAEEIEQWWRREMDVAFKHAPLRSS
ncbi:shikimate kinase [Polycladomyces subterraneus]|uniref:Shikimate kinase n=1 Tax=Polycladomyces subterraneus TaxID=1016997 RepID=A0ABT8IR62_9BACL|nr:shikimate kinase [Polycladomyces subterraneus]MDN4594887.1 shikimate kinase [Polycladomyces subterraneus]